MNICVKGYQLSTPQKVDVMINFENNKLIFSDEKKYRIRRHLLFWGCVTFYIFLTRFLNPTRIIANGRLDNPATSYVETLIFFMPQVVLVYPLLYFILPRYLFNGKYIKAALWILAFLILTVCINAVLIMYIPWYKPPWLSSKLKLFAGMTPLQKFGMAWMAGFSGSLLGAALATCFKMSKYYYLKNMRNQQLQKENVESQLQLLKAQVHPHFLFNTLNNIYSQTQLESPKGSKMIMGLSDMLRYILYEGQKPLVPLKKELMMITEYINLEKIRYGNKLDVHILTPDNTDDIYMAPLILLPFVENCFKHGTSNMLENPWINLTIELKDTTLTMKLMNGKAPSKENGQNKTGIGINNVRQRLELLYKDKHDLQIREDEEVFVVDLRIELVQIENEQQINILLQPQSSAEYV
jgi:sensor histidine kinase YesM